MNESHIAIVGLGLLGGSMAFALNRRAALWDAGDAEGVPPRITAVAREQATIDKALALGIIDEGTTDVRAGVAGADLVVFATPVGTIPHLVQQCAPSLRPGAIVTDVGSTKRYLMETIPPLLPKGVEYIGGHPMAGSEQSGLEAADPYLFENAMYVITPARHEQPGLSKVQTLVERIGAQPLIMDALRHDRIVAAISHLPHMVAAALVEAVGIVAQTDATVFALAAGGFRDTTRIAAGDPHMWRDIFLSNRTQVVDMLDRFSDVLDRLRRATDEQDEAGLVDVLQRSRSLREQLPRHRQGLLRPMFEIVVQLADKPGGISEVTGCIAAKHVNITDIEVLRAREGEAGALRLAFAQEEDVELALGALTDIGFVARRRE